MLFITPLVLLATLSSALPAPVVPPMALEARSGDWKAPIFDAMGLNRAKIVANATLEARQAFRIVKNPKNPKTYWRPSSSSAPVVEPEAQPTTAEIVEPTPEPTTEAAPTTSSTPSSTSISTAAPKPTVVPFKGQATYFFQEGNPGACGVYNQDSTPLVALDWRLYGDMSRESPDCGRKLTITNTDNGKSVVAIAQDACPSCASKYSLDLSTGAFDAIGDRDTGILPISWVWND